MNASSQVEGTPPMIDQYRIATDEEGNWKKTSSSDHFTAYLGSLEDTRVVIYVLNREDSVERAHLTLALDHLVKTGYEGILPKVLSQGEHESKPYYVTKSREGTGQPLSHFLKTEKIHPRKAARLIFEFIEGYLEQRDKWFVDFCENSLWIEDTILGSQLGLRDIPVTIYEPLSEREKAKILYRTFLQLFDGNLDDARYLTHLKRIEKSQNSLRLLGKALHEFSLATFVEKTPVIRKSDRQKDLDDSELENPIAAATKDETLSHHDPKGGQSIQSSILNFFRSSSRKSKKRLFNEMSFLELDTESEEKEAPVPGKAKR